ncbi:MAG: TrbC/VirB2 family protein [Rickettsiales bacterium]|nr:TrbC/VirB2 family protein [Rickettsiales bacterium]
MQQPAHNITTRHKESLRFSWQALLVFVASVAMSGNSYADEFSIMCQLSQQMMDGTLGKGLGIIAVMILSVAAIVGKASWGLAAGVLVGISVIYGAGAIALRLSDDEARCTGNTPLPVGTDMAGVLCDVVQIIQSELGAGIATLSIITVGISAALGKGSWGTAITVAVGIAILFGAASIVDFFLGIEACM